MSKCIRKNVSHDGSLKVGGPAPNWTLSDTDSQRNYGTKSTTPWNVQEKLITKNYLDQQERTNAGLKSLLYDKSCRKALAKLIHSRKPKLKTGPKNRLTDEQVIYARKEIRVRSLKSLVDELKVTRKTLEDAVKGRSFKHLNEIEKPQL